MGIYSDVLLAVDYDRTLTATDSTVPQRNLEAIRYFMENGGAFTVNTGRSLPMAMAFMDKVPMNAPLLLCNGSAAYDVQKRELCFMHRIDMDLWETVAELMELFPDLTVEVQALDKHYAFAPNPPWEAFSANNCAYGIARWGQDLGPFLKFSLYGEIRDVTVDHLFHGSEEEIARMDDAQALVQERYGDKVVPYRAGPRIIDVHAKGCSKARAARELLSQLDRKILVCVGDAENDILMLEDADYAFVPGDAILRDRFENVCPCGEGAIADVIYEKIPAIVNSTLDKRE